MPKTRRLTARRGQGKNDLPLTQPKLKTRLAGLMSLRCLFVAALAGGKFKKSLARILRQKELILKRRAIVAALLLCAAGFGAFADMGMYIKGTLGYGYRSREWSYEYSYEYEDYYYDEYGFYSSTYDFDTSSNLFVIIPTFGIEPWRGNGNAFLRGLSFEFSVDLGFGKAKGEYEGLDSSSVVINPRIMAVYTYRAGMVAPYVGLGVSVPIVIISELGGDDWNWSEEDYYPDYYYYKDSIETPGVKVGFNGNIMAGIGFQVTEKVMPTIEVDFGFGTGIRVDARAGLVYRLR